MWPDLIIIYQVGAAWVVLRKSGEWTHKCFVKWLKGMLRSCCTFWFLGVFFFRKWWFRKYGHLCVVSAHLSFGLFYSITFADNAFLGFCHHNMTFFMSNDSHQDKLFVRLSLHYNVNYCTGKTASMYWDGLLVPSNSWRSSGTYMSVNQITIGWDNGLASNI